jgi:uncharacterized protein YigE (DUF2233 family)
MFIIYDCAACFLAALIGGTLLFTAGVICVMLMEAGGIAWRRWPALTQRATWLMGRWTAEPREPYSRWTLL